jgi:hypothetical protein
MLNDKERAFISYWESVREEEASFPRKLLRGLPFALLFFLPIPVLLIVVYLYLPDWYARVSNRLPGATVTILLAIFLMVLFFAFFRMHFNWERNEHYYLMLKRRISTDVRNQEEASPIKN